MTLQTKAEPAGFGAAQEGNAHKESLFFGLARRIETQAKSALNMRVKITDQSSVSGLIFAYSRGRIDRDVCDRMAEKMAETHKYLGEVTVTYKELKKFSEFFSSDRVLNLCDKYGPDAGREVMPILWPHTMPSHYLEVDRLSRQEFGRLESQLKILASDEVAEQVRETFAKFEGESAREILGRLAYLSQFIDDASQVAGIARLINLAGVDIFKEANNDFNRSYHVARTGLYNLASDRESAMAIISYALSIDRGSFKGSVLEEPKAALPRPTRENLEGYRGLVLEHFAREYGLRESMSWESILMLIPMGKEKVEKLAPLIGAFGLQRALELEVSFNFSLMEVEAVREFAQLIKAAKETNVREYAIKQSGSEKVEELNYTKEELLEYSVISIIGSRSKEREDKAVKAMSMIVGIELINRAREEFRAKHKALMGQLIGAVKQSDFVLAHKILGDTEAHSIMDVLNAANYREIKIANASFLRAVESKNPLDYDGRVQIACVYLPNSSPIGIRAYCKDDNVVLIRYDIGDKAVGSAICYKLGDKFLIDSVEGHRTFRKDQIFEIVYEDLLKRAKDHNSKEILFHKDAPNETPKLFIAHLGQKGLATEKLGVEFDVGDVYIEAHKKSECYVVKLAE